MRHFWSILFFLLIGTSVSFGQTINYFGFVKDYDSGKPMAGVDVQVLSNGSIVSTAVTAADGSFSVKFPPGKTYKIEFSKDGYVAKHAKFESEKINAELMPPGGKITPPNNIDLFAKREGADFSFLKDEPIVDWYFDGSQMIYDRGKVNRTKRKIQDALKAAAAHKTNSAADYNALITAADALFKEQKYKEAQQKYVEAIKIPGKQAEPYPNQQIVKIDNLLQQKEQEELAYKQAHEEYFNTIKAADLLANNKQFEEAIKKYQAASALDPTQQYPKDRIAELQATVKEAEKKKQYDDLIKRADGFLNQNSLRAARDAYQEASDLFPNEPYPKEQLAKMKSKLDAKLAQLEKTKKYNAAVKAGDELFNQKKYKEAIDKYKEALTYESAATYPTSQITKAEAIVAAQDKFNLLVSEGDKNVGIKDYATAIKKYDEALTIQQNDTVKVKRSNAQKLLDQQNEMAASTAKFDSLVALADKAVGIKDYQVAIDNYNLALKIKTDDNVKTKRDQAQQLMANEKNAKEKEAKIQALLASASSKMTAKDYEGAVSAYDSVLVLNTQQSDAITGKAKALQLLKDQKEATANQQKFDELVAKADKAFDKKSWDESKKLYTSAKELISDNEHVNNRIDEITGILQKQLAAKNKAEDIQTLITQGQAFEVDQKWDDAIGKYQAALKLDDSREDVKKLIAAAQQKKKDWEEQQGKDVEFNKLKTAGVNFMGKEAWVSAKEKFEAALKIKEDKEINAFLKQIDQKIEEAQAAKAIDAKYQAKMKEGEDFATNKEYAKAITSFQEALKIKENDATAQERIKDIQQLLGNKADAVANQKAYDKAIKDGKKALEDKDYAAAIKSFDDALLAKPLDPITTQLKKQAQGEIQALKLQEEKYQNFVDLGQKAYDMAVANQNDTTLLRQAKSKFESAQEIKPEASLPQQKIVEIDQLLRQIQEDLAKKSTKSVDEEYQEQLDLAKTAGQNERYKSAIDHLRKALTFKPNESFPPKQIKEYEALLKQKALAQQVDRKYDSLITKADIDFSSEDYQASIGNYQKALKVKPNETYPPQQIAKAQAAMASKQANAVDQQYQNLIKKADDAFNAKSYEGAIGLYQQALQVKENDEYAQNQIQKAQALLVQLAQQQAANNTAEAAYKKYIVAADTSFNQTNYTEALKLYRKALSVKPNDVYANSRVQLCIDKAKQKTANQNDNLYQQILSKADQYFADKNYDKATNLYKRALSLRSNDVYPQNQLDKIEDIKNGSSKRSVEIADLGDPDDISIMEGAALLQKGAQQRKQMQLDAVKKRLHQSEDVAMQHGKKDYQGSLDIQNKVTNIKDRAQQEYLDHKDEHRETVNQLDQLRRDYDKKMDKRNNYEKGSVLRTQQAVQYVQDDVDQKKKDLTADHRETIEQVKKIRRDRENQTRAEIAAHESAMSSNRDELNKIRVRNENMAAANKVKEDDIAVSMDELKHNMEKKAFAERNDLKSHALQMQRNIVTAQIKDAESKAGKEAIQDQIRQDMRSLTASLQRKASQEAHEVQQQQIAIEGQLTAQQDKYDKARADNVLDHQMIVQNVRQLKQAQDVQQRARAAKEYEGVQNTVDHLENTRKIQEEAARQQKKDLSEVNETIKSYQISLDQKHQLKQEDEITAHQNTVDHLDAIRSDEKQAKAEKAAQTKQNYETVKGIKASIEKNESVRVDMLKKKKMEIQQTINKLEDNKITFSPKIANTIGDIYPEGVSQENYIRRDAKGIPVKIITRRFVVIKGHGDIYIRIQTRNGVTYSKNGKPITRNGWVQGTQNANLVRHY